MHRIAPIIWLLVLALSSVAAPGATGESAALPALPATYLSPRILQLDPFAKGQWTADFSAAYTQPTYIDRNRFVTGSLGLGYAPIDRATVGLEITGDYMANRTSTGAGGGFDLRGRFELLKLGSTTLFIDGSAGILESDHPVPHDGTHFNFIETIGFGAYHPLAPRLLLMGGVRFEHVSNAGINVNPGYNGVQVYLGVSVPL